MSNRRISVYDVTALRVHPDGRRVDPTANNPRSRYWAPGATQDDQGNWIAVDAAGSFHVPRYTKRRRTGFESEDEEEEDGGDGLDGEESDDGYKEEASRKERRESAKAKGKARESVGKDKGPQYRKRFKKDESYLGASRSSSTNVPPDIPSQGLLKAIHHFTSNHYAENGFLHNSSKQYRMRRKKRREAKRAAQRKAEGVDNEAPTSKTPAEDEESSGTESNSDADSDEERRGSETNELEPPPIDPAEPGSSKLRGPGRPKRSKQYRDMYRVFDGSALMAIGILCQEYVRHLVKAPNAPHEREESNGSSKRKRSREVHPSSTGDTNEDNLPSEEGLSKQARTDDEGTQSEDEELPNLAASSWTANTYPAAFP